MAQSRWTLRGRLLLMPSRPEIKAEADVAVARDDKNQAVPLAGVPVKVSAKQFGADLTGWEKWAEGVTDEDGRFEVHASKNQSGRRFKVEAIFKDDTLKIYPPNDSLLKTLVELARDVIPGTAFTQLTHHLQEVLLEQLLEQTSRITYDVKWQTLFESASGDKQDGPEVDFHNLTFATDAVGDRGDFFVRRHAEIWYIVKRAMKYLNNLGLGFRNDRPIAFLHPHDNSALPDSWQSSYSNPHNDIVYLVQTPRQDDFKVGTILHEMMHLWAYQQVRKEEKLATYVVTHFDTHKGRHKHWVAWHEAFAEVTSNELYRQMFGTRDTIYGDLTAKIRPYSRPYLKRQGVLQASDLSEFEDGWQAALNLLLCPDVCSLDMSVYGPYAADLSPGKKGPTGLCSAPRMRLVDLLRAVATPGKSRDGDFPTDAMKLPEFFSWMAVPEFTEEVRLGYAKILDPNETRQPRELLLRQLKPVEHKVDRGNISEVRPPLI